MPDLSQYTNSSGFITSAVVSSKPTMYTTTGIVLNPLKFIGTTTTAMSGSTCAWTINYSNVPFSTITCVQANVVSANPGALSTSYFVFPYAPSTSVCSGYVLQPAQIVLGGNPFAMGPAGLTVLVEISGY